MANPTSRSVLDKLALTTAVRSMVTEAYGDTLNAQDIDDKVKEFLVELTAGYEDQQSLTVAGVGPSREARTGNEKVFDILMALLAGCAGTEIANLVAGVASSFGRKYLGPKAVSYKRFREQEEDVESGSGKKARVGNDGATTVNFASKAQEIGHDTRSGAQSVKVQGSPAAFNSGNESGKGPVLSAASDSDSKSLKALAGPSPALKESDEVCAPITASRSHNRSVNGEVNWAEYACDESDSSYAPSTGTSDDDDAHMTQEDLQELFEYRENCLQFQDLDYISGNLTSEDETGSNYAKPTDIRWKDYPSEEESDTDDGDYVPPNWTFEDVLEIVTDPALGWEVDRLYHMNEIIDREPLSDAGISDSDNDASNPKHERFKLHDISTLRRYFSDYSVPKHLTTYNTLPSYFYIDRFKNDRPMLDARKDDIQWHRKHALELSKKTEQRKTEPGWKTCDTDARLDTVLDNGHLEYAFDEWEWRGFEDPRRSSTPQE